MSAIKKCPECGYLMAVELITEAINQNERCPRCNGPQVCVFGDDSVTQTCSNCRYWGKTELQAKTRGKMKSCGKITGEDETLAGNQMVSAVHDGGYMSDLFTGAKFGCIHWEQK